MDYIVMIMLTVGSPCDAKGLCQYVMQPIVPRNPDVTMMSAPDARTRSAPAGAAPDAAAPSSVAP